MGTVHGGYYATLMDGAMGCAVHTTLNAGESYATLEIAVKNVKVHSTRKRNIY